MIRTDDPQTPPGWPRFFAFLIGLAVCGVSQWHIFQRSEWFWSSWGIALGALVAAWAAGRPQPLRAAETRPLAAEPVGGVEAAIGALLIAAGLVVSAYGSWLLSTVWDTRFGVGWGLVLAGLTAFSVGISRLDRPFRKDAEPLPWLRWEVVAFVAIVLLGLFLRFWRYDVFPPPDGSCAIEEPQSGMGAEAIRNGLRPWEFLLDRWLPVPFMALLGDTLTAIRVPFTLVSWLTIIPFYLLMRELVSRPAALGGTLLFAFARWHLAYARSAHAIFGPTLPLILVALWLAVRVYRRGGLAAWPWIGALCCYTLYSYAGYRATPAFIGLFFAISVVQHLWEYRQAVIPSARDAIRRSLRVQFAGFVLAGVGFALLAVPLYSQLTKNPAYFVEAVERATNNPQYYHEDAAKMLQQRIDRVRDTAMMFNHLGDGSAVFNIPGAPQLDPVSGALFVLGLAYCLVWGGVRMQGFFAAYFLVLLAFGTVFTHNFDIRRLQGVIPLVFILVAFFLDGAGHFVRRRLGRHAWVPLALAAAVLGGLAFRENWNLYFRDMMASPTVRQAFHTNYTIAIRYYHDMPEGSYLRLVSEMSNFFMPSDWSWWRGNRLPGDTSHDLHDLLAGRPGPWDGRELHVVIRMPTYEGHEIAALVQRRFPDAACSVYVHPDGPIWATFMSCILGPQTYGDGRDFGGGIVARYYRGTEEPILERREPAVSYALVPDECRYPKNRMRVPCRVVWEGTWNVPEAGVWQLMANTLNGTVRVFVGDRELARNPAAGDGPDRVVDTALELPAGPVAIRVESEWSDIDAVGTNLRLRRGGESDWRLLEFWDLAHGSKPPDPPDAPESDS